MATLHTDPLPTRPLPIRPLPIRPLSGLLAGLLLALLATIAPAALVAQDVPDNIPDLPGESPADRAQEQLIERHRGFLSRLFTTGSFDAGSLPRAPVAGLAYQTTARLGLELRSGDAVFVAFNSRLIPGRESLEPGVDAWVWYAGGGYTLSGTRLLGESEAGRRAALSAELGAWSGETSLVALDLSPTYEILRGRSWSVPAGVRFSLARVSGPDGMALDPFLGLTIGAKVHFFARERLELK